MRPRRPNPRVLVASAVALVLAAACTAYQPGWTFDPTIGRSTGAPPSGTPTSPGAGSGPSSGPGPTVPTGSGPASTPGGGSPGTPGGAVIDLVAMNIAFDKHDLSASAGAAFVIQFDNQDAGVPHNVAIYSDSSKTSVLFRGTVVTGPAKTQYSVGALQAGTYYFQCDVHPGQMNGTIVVH